MEIQVDMQCNYYLIFHRIVNLVDEGFIYYQYFYVGSYRC